MSDVSTREIDVVIPVFNGENYLAEAIESVLAQDYPVSKIIVVDDGSTDGSADIASRFANVELLQQENQGPAIARNLGLQSACAEFVAFLDADDRWLPVKTGVQMKALLADSQLDMVFGGMDYFYSPELAPEDYPMKPGPQDKAYLIGTMLARRESFFRVGLLSTDLLTGEFIDWYARAMALELRKSIVGCVVMQRRLHANNYTRQQRDSRSEYLKVLRAKLKASRAVDNEC